MAVRTRYAPSPTGYLHVGGAWMAFFTWLFTRHEGGQFVLRIEDTDRSRSTEAFEAAILEDLRWLGITWDEGPDVGGPVGPYRQTERAELYREHAGTLVVLGAAYPCYCLPEELEAERRRAAAERRPYRYSGRCRELTAAGRAEMEAAGRRATLRFRVPSLHGPLLVDDLVLGRVEFAAEDLDDFIIQRSDGTPLYNFANVVDDHAMRITHITRGAEHLSNTPRQFLMYEAFGWDQPRVAHFPSLLGVDRKKLSKRHGDTAVREYKAQGYLPEALVNFFALMGWYPEDGREIFSVEEMIARFRIEDVGKSGAVFDAQKLTWMNGVYLHQALRRTPERVVDLVVDALRQAGLFDGLGLRREPEASPSGAGGPERRAYVARVVEIMGERLRLPKDLLTYGDFFFTEEVAYDPQAVRKQFHGAATVAMLGRLRDALARVAPFNLGGIEQAVRDTAAALGVESKDVIHPLRVALTGKTVGPGLFELIEVLGKDRVLARLERAMRLADETAACGGGAQ
ncbi:MAG TPA: glutamate--tRNA ligase [bacterium]|nr:glutamate--tRNA ligase [bacterium]